MSNQTIKGGGRLSSRRFSACVAASLATSVLIGAVVVFGFSGEILNGYGKRKVERAFAEAHPQMTLRIGELHYSLDANRLVAQAITISATNTTFSVQRVSLSGVGWSRLFWGSAVLSDVLANASLDATNLDLQFAGTRYGIHCARLRASVPDSELIAEGAGLQPLVGDEEFFAARPFRASRFHVAVAECKVSGLAYGDLLEGKAYRARSLRFTGATVDALVNHDKPLNPDVKPPLMVHEALAAIRQPLQIDNLSVTNGRLIYCERMVAGGEPGILTISEANLSADNIANRGPASATILVRGEGKLMEAGTLKVALSIPIKPPDFSVHYSGSLSAMDLTRLNAFLEIDTRIRLKSGNAQEASFEIDVDAGHARGHVRGIYRDLKIAMIDKTGAEKGFDNRAASFFANVVKIRGSNVRDASGAEKEGRVDYIKKPPEEFQQFLWLALRTGVLDTISR